MLGQRAQVVRGDGAGHHGGEGAQMERTSRTRRRSDSSGDRLSHHSECGSPGVADPVTAGTRFQAEYLTQRATTGTTFASAIATSSPPATPNHLRFIAFMAAQA